MRKLTQFRHKYRASRVVNNDYFPLQGGLNLVDSPLTVAPGNMLRGLNYEAFVNGGYRSIGGFERFDGRPSPSRLILSRIVLDTISDVSVIEPGHTLRWNDGASFARVLEIDVPTKELLVEGNELPVSGTPVFIQERPWLRRADRHHLTLSKNGSPNPNSLVPGFWIVDADDGSLLIPNGGALLRPQRRMTRTLSLDMHPGGRLYAGAGDGGNRQMFAAVDRLTNTIEGRPIRENDFLPDQQSNVVSFSTDGRRLVVGHRDQGFRVFDVEAKAIETGWPELQENNTLWAAKWSLDGRWLAVVARRPNGRFELHVLDVNTKSIVASVGHNTSQSDGWFSMTFTHDGGTLVYAVVSTGNNTILRRMTLPDGNVTTNPPGSVTTRLVDMAISPDGNRIIFARSQEITPGKVWFLDAPFSGFPIPYPGLDTGGVIDIGDAVSIAWSPDGDKFGVGIETDNSSSPGYLVFNTDGSRDTSFSGLPSDWGRDGTDITWAWSPMAVDSVIIDTEAPDLIDQLREDRRDDIEEVPGAGPVRGVQHYDGNTYAFRDGTGDDLDQRFMWRSSPEGWQRIEFDPILAFNEGTNEIKRGDVIRNENGDEKERYEVLAVIKNLGFWLGEVEPDPDDPDAPQPLTAEGYIVYRWLADNEVPEPSLSSQWNEGDPIIIMGNVEDGDADDELEGAVASDDAEELILDAGGGPYEFEITNFRGHESRPLLYGVDGVNNAFEFDSEKQAYIPIRTGMDDDHPNHLAAHKDHLFLSFPGGSIQNSSTNDPLSWSVVTGANEMLVGTECTGFVPEVGGALLIFGENRNLVLHGDTTDNFQLNTLSTEVGAIDGSVNRLGQGIFLDRRGFTTARATDAFGDFISNSISFKIQPLIDNTRPDAPIENTIKIRERWAGFEGGVSQLNRKLSVYRYWPVTGPGISIGFAGNDPIGITLVNYGKNLTCTSMASDGESEERLFFGADDGFVYEQDIGTSFDGEPITAYMTLAFNHSGSPSIEKQYRKMSIDLSTFTDFEIFASVELDFSDPHQTVPFYELVKEGKSAIWNEENWNQFLWSTGSNIMNPAFYIDAAGYNLALHVYYENKFMQPHVLSGAHLHWSPRRLKREL